MHIKIKISTHARTLLSRELLCWLLIITNWWNVCLCVSPCSRQSTEQNRSTANNHRPSKTIPLAASLAINPQNMRSSLVLGALSDTMGVGCSKALILFQRALKVLCVLLPTYWKRNIGTSFFCYSGEYSDVLAVLQGSQPAGEKPLMESVLTRWERGLSVRRRGAHRSTQLKEESTWPFPPTALALQKDAAAS